MTRFVVQASWDDVAHLSETAKAEMAAAYPAYQRDARIKGIPSRGSGLVFPIAEEAITIAPFEIPAHWPSIGGIDFGWDHPTAAAKLAWDRDADCLYVTHAYRLREATPVIHAGSLKPWGSSLPWAWPHDGLQHDKGSGDELAALYRAQGLRMLPERATFADGSNGFEAGLMEMLERMETGRWKVFAHLADWFEEFRNYYRKDGLVVKLRDDILSASRYALMMKRYARTAERRRPVSPPSPGPRTGNSSWQAM